MSEKKEYKNTLNLPVTDFPMKAGLPEREPLFLKKWEEEDIYKKIRQKYKGAKQWILHDGPPYANGDIHIGHALNKILKDIFVKYKTMCGFDSPYVPGWDCHGLPVEHQLFKELKITKHEIAPVDFRKKAAAYAMGFVEKQKAQFKRLGVFGDWERPYLTLAPEFEAGVIDCFAKLAEKGFIFQSLKPVHWCASCETALAEAELEYDENHVSPSITVLFPVVSQKFSLAVWTTTPWTLMANVAVALNPTFTYCVVRTKRFGDVVVVEERLDALMKLVSPDGSETAQVIGKKRGNELEGLEAQHPFLSRASKVINADYVSREDGTGMVHIAPGHGMDDYRTGLQYKLPILMPVDGKGVFTKDAGELEGTPVWKANEKIIEILTQKEHLVHAGQITHSYPTCWRCRRPVLTRATRQWFLGVDKNDLRKKTLEAIKKVRWVPSVGQNRISGMMETRPDWCLSRQRYWGVPIPVLYCTGCDEPVLDATLIRLVRDLFRKEGSDAWFLRSAMDITQGKFACPKCGRKDLKKGEDILDVWFESGASHVPVLIESQDMRFPADLYLEGSDQHRGWFHSSLLISCGIHDGKPPYEEVLTHGFIVDGEGKKMSKSQGNVVSPQKVMEQYGADILRLWVLSADISDDIRISQDGLTRLAEGYRKVRNTFKYLLGNLHGFDPKSRLEPDQMLEVDRWALSKLEQLKEEVASGYDSRQLHRSYHAVYNFCVREMSSFYLDMLKDRLYTDAKDSISGRSCRTALYDILTELTCMLAPVLSFTSEEVWQSLGRTQSVHLEAFPKAQKKRRDTALEARYERFMAARDKVLKALEASREKKEIGNSLEAEVELGLSKSEDEDFLKSFKAELPGLFLVSQVSWAKAETPDTDGWQIAVRRAKGQKCERCWIWRETVGKDAEHPTLCHRCADVLKRSLT